MERAFRLASLVLAWIVGLALLAHVGLSLRRDAARDERERARDDREDQRDKREKARDQREADRDDARKSKRAPVQWELFANSFRAQMLVTNFDASETRYVCGFASVTHKKTNVGAKSTEVCTGGIPPRSTLTIELPFQPGAIEHLCVDEGRGFTWDACSLEFVKTER